ncbi:peptidoglycan D,D-transpeptidase FtsI family protein [Mariluticola halotolerans]|uniref:peptidoglycan D,D-transpeptidase FtsI family protein n=1 Tax=Mariluticola halotolerans TaxID=2909283 RepID=UPI0026E47D9D|nr:penicillin-binding protein 2 [Mariluticola halotolerans]UJQ94600.1 penicillin-binding protein 2 [Mariluticola halotolerans]
MSMMSTEAQELISLEGERKTQRNLTHSRIRWVMLGLLMLFGLVGGRLVQLGYANTDTDFSGEERDLITATRPAILDRNGLEMALDIRVPSLYAEPRRIIDVEEAVEKLTGVLPELDPEWLRKRLTGDQGFVWVARELTPLQKEKIFRLGIPGLDFRTESKRYYPASNEASHLLGTVNRDNQGISGFEMHLDNEDVALLQDLGLARDRTLEPVRMSVDLRVQHALTDELADSLVRYQATAAAGVIMNVKTGEVVAMASLPDFNPNEPATALEPYEGRKGARINRITAGTFELGSIFKTITLAAAIDSGVVKLTDSFDARFPVRFGRFSINDFHGKHTILTVPEIYKYSSNIGTIKIMQAFGAENYRSFLTRLGFDDPLTVELPETTRSNIPKKFSEVGAATASFGAGLATTPMHMVAALGALVNGGHYVPPTLYPRTEAEARALSRPVVSEATSAKTRYLLRLNALEGSGSRANKIAKGYRMGGKTGTAEKVIDGRYSKEKNLAIFASAFPLDAPQYAMVIMVDEAVAENERSGRTAGWNAGEMSGRVVQRIAPMLGILPDFDTNIDLALVPMELR